MRVRVRPRARFGLACVIVALLALACGPAAAPGPTAPPAPTQAAAKPAAPTAAPASLAPTAAAAPAETAAPPAAANELTDSERASVEAFYKDKTFTIVVGFSAGGGYDTYSRLLARYLGKHIPGHPNVIVENKTGAGSLIAANYIYNLAPKDGTQMAMFDQFLVLGQAAGKSGIEFDARKFNWVGNPAPDPPACVFRSDLGFDSFADLLSSGQEVVMGATGVGSAPYATAAALAAVSGAKLKVVSGYEGTSKIRLAVENREADGACWEWSSIRVTAANWFEGAQPFGKVLVQTGTKRQPGLQDVPLWREFIKNADKAKLLDVHDAAEEIARPWALPPGVPPERVKAVRLAMLEALNDPEAKAEAQQSNLVLAPQDHRVLEQAVGTIFNTAPQELATMAEVLGLK